MFELMRVMNMAWSHHNGNVNATLSEDYPHQSYYAISDGNAVMSYVVDEGKGAFYIVLNPAEAAGGFADRVLQMLQSFEITMNSTE